VSTEACPGTGVPSAVVTTRAHAARPDGCRVPRDHRRRQATLDDRPCTDGRWSFRTSAP